MNSRMAFAIALLSVALVGCGDKGVSVSRGSKKLTLFTPPDSMVKQGESTQVPVKIAREGFTDPVVVHLEGLPPGVTADGNTTFGAGQDTLNLALHASGNAPAASTSEVRVICEASGGLATKCMMKLVVKAK